MEKNKEVFLEYHKVRSGDEIDNLDDILTSDFVCHHLTSEKWTGIKEAKKNILDWRVIFRDWNEKIVDVIQEKDKAVIRYKATEIHSKTYEANDSTRAQIEIYKVSI